MKTEAIIGGGGWGKYGSLLDNTYKKRSRYSSRAVSDSNIGQNVTFYNIILELLKCENFPGGPP